MGWNGFERRHQQAIGRNLGRRKTDRPDEQKAADNWYPFSLASNSADFDLPAANDDVPSSTDSSSDFSGGGGSFDGGGASGDW